MYIPKQYTSESESTDRRIPRSDGESLRHQVSSSDSAEPAARQHPGSGVLGPVAADTLCFGEASLNNLQEVLRTRKMSKFSVRELVFMLCALCIIVLIVLNILGVEGLILNLMLFTASLGAIGIALRKGGQ